MRTIFFTNANYFCGKSKILILQKNHLLRFSRSNFIDKNERKHFQSSSLHIIFQVLRSIVRRCQGFRMRHSLTEAINAIVLIRINPRAEVLAALACPPNRIQRRVSFAGTRQPMQSPQPPQQQPSQQQNMFSNRFAGGITNRRVSVADFRSTTSAQPAQSNHQNLGGQTNVTPFVPTVPVASAQPMNISAASQDSAVDMSIESIANNVSNQSVETLEPVEPMDVSYGGHDEADAP